MEPFIDGGLFELCAILFVVLNGLNLIYGNKAFLFTFSIVCIGMVIFSFVQATTTSQIVISTLFLLCSSSLNAYLWHRKIKKPKDVLFDTNVLKQKILRMVKVDKKNS